MTHYRWRASAAAAGVPRGIIRRESSNRGDYIREANAFAWRSNWRHGRRKLSAIWRYIAHFGRWEER